jgi:hypothetical protein
MGTRSDRCSTRKLSKPRKCTRSRASSREDVIFQPWFLSGNIAQAIRRLVPPGYSLKMRDYFAQWGCMRCSSKHARYGAIGFCDLCHTKLRRRLRTCIKRRANATTPNQYGLKYLTDGRIAQKLLRGLPPTFYVEQGSHARRSRYSVNNPARAASIVLSNYVPGHEVSGD